MLSVSSVFVKLLAPLHRLVHWLKALTSEYETRRGSSRCRLSEDVSLIRTARCLFADTDHEGNNQSVAESARL